MSTKIKNRILKAVIAVTLLTLAGCGPWWPELAFSVHFVVNVDGHTVASIKVQNEGAVPFFKDKDFDGVFELRDEAGNVLLHQDVPELDRLSPGDSFWPPGWKGTLAAGKYQWIWGAPGHDFATVDFDIVERNGELFLDENSVRVSQVETLPAKKQDLLFRLPESAVTFRWTSADLTEMALLNGEGYV